MIYSLENILTIFPETSSKDWTKMHDNGWRHKTASIKLDYKFIGHGTVIGPGTVIEPGVIIGSETFIGSEVFIGFGAVIDSYSVIPDGSIIKLRSVISIGDTDSRRYQEKPTRPIPSRSQTINKPFCPHCGHRSMYVSAIELQKPFNEMVFTCDKCKISSTLEKMLEVATSIKDFVSSVLHNEPEK